MTKKKKQEELERLIAMHDAPYWAEVAARRRERQAHAKPWAITDQDDVVIVSFNTEEEMFRCFYSGDVDRYVGAYEEEWTIASPSSASRTTAKRSYGTRRRRRGDDRRGH